MKPVQKRLLIAGSVVALGAVAYYLYDRSQNPALSAAPPAGGGGGGISPQPKAASGNKPSAGQIQAYKDAVSALDQFQKWVAANPPTNQAELDAMVAKAEEFKQAVRRTAAVIGVSPGV